MKLIDTHTHINMRAFENDATETIQRALDSGVAIINVGTQIDTSRQAVALLDKFPENVYAAIGLHPSHTYGDDYEDDDEVKSKTLEEGFDPELYREIAQHPRVVGIGECGLDYYRLPKNRDHVEIKELQRRAFDEQIKLALELDKALCIHCRPSNSTNDAYEDLLAIIQLIKHPPEGVQTAWQDTKNFRFEVHCFTGDIDMALKFVELGGFIGLNGIITFDKTDRSEKLVKGLPLENIILETDAPYLTPKSKRGERNEPSYLLEVAEKIAEWKNITVDEVAHQTTENAIRLFKL